MKRTAWIYRPKYALMTTGALILVAVSWLSGHWGLLGLSPFCFALISFLDRRGLFGRGHRSTPN
jgi:hypothetical protein